MDSAKKLYISVGVLVALGVGLALQNKSKNEEAKSYSYEAKVADLPKVEISEDTKKAIDRIELVVPKEEKKDKAEGEPESEPDATNTKPDQFVLVKKGEEDWALEAPGAYKANASNVQSLLDNLEKIKVVETVASGTDAYERWGLTEDKALHVVAKKAGDTVIDVYFGEDGSRGQMLRFAGKDGVYAAKGYSKFMYSRDLKGWRDKTIFKFEEAEVESVTVKNENGVFAFTKDGDKWTSQHTPAGGKAGSPIPRFKDSKVGDLLRAYKSLNAADFGDDKQPDAVRLNDPLATVTVQVKGGTKHELLVGDSGEGGTRYVKTPENPQLYTISSWAGDWATAGIDKFQEKDESKPEETKDAKKPAPKKPASPAAP